MEQLAGKMQREANLTAAATKLGQNPSPSVDIKTGSLFTAKRLTRDRGIAGLYSGYRLHLLRDTIGTAIYFATYESAKQILANARGREPTSAYAVVVAGGLCGIVSWACIYPVDVAKTVYQKALLSAEAGQAVRPKIKFFEFGSYRGELPIYQNEDQTPANTYHRSRCFGLPLMSLEHDLFQQLRDDEEAHQQSRRERR